MMNCILLLYLMALPLLAQHPPITVLDIEIDNAVRYIGDVTDPARLATVTTRTTPGPARAFTDTIFAGDIVSINGKPARGLWTSRQYVMGFNPNPTPGNAVSDVTQGTIAECKYEIQNAEGAFIGRLMDGGLFPHAISGGTGAFLGAGGEQGSAPVTVNPVPIRAASMTEDPSVRRILGGGRSRIILRILPLFRPGVETVNGAPLVYHADDFTLVTADHPARAGEVLIIRANNLGPTTPYLDPGVAFPAGQTNIVNAPVEVTVNGATAQVINQIGWPETTGSYRVDFRVPGNATGQVRLQLTSAWIQAPEVTIPVR
jgi:uncharacterized protein (TIGR03437 family)